MTVLWLTEQQAQDIVAHARQQAPGPASGLIAGRDGEALAFYRSLPPGGRVPTAPERHKDKWPDGPHVFVTLKGDQVRFAAWDFQQDRATPLELHISDQPPPPPHIDQRLSRAQTTAILASAALAFALLIVLSLYLLPAAPPTP